uniref:CSON000448 protein n=2 Tax=Culicoides sonorensis TaxID=179676 RepID=A0A336L5E3_CULSO
MTAQDQTCLLLLIRFYGAVMRERVVVVALWVIFRLYFSLYMAATLRPIKIGMKKSILLKVNAASESTKWESYKRKYGKMYKNSEDEAIHKAIYLKNMREIEIHNSHYRKGEFPYWKEENEFTDLTEDEFRHYYRSILMEERGPINYVKSNNNANKEKRK